MTQPAGELIIERTPNGTHELQRLHPPCAYHEHGIRCPHPATVVLGLRGFAQGRDYGVQFCAVHGFARLGQLEPMGQAS